MAKTLKLGIGYVRNDKPIQLYAKTATLNEIEAGAVILISDLLKMRWQPIGADHVEFDIPQFEVPVKWGPFNIKPKIKITFCLWVTVEG